MKKINKFIVAFIVLATILLTSCKKEENKPRKQITTFIVEHEHLVVIGDSIGVGKVEIRAIDDYVVADEEIKYETFTCNGRTFAFFRAETYFNQTFSFAVFVNNDFHPISIKVDAGDVVGYAYTLNRIGVSLEYRPRFGQAIRSYKTIQDIPCPFM